MYRCSVISMHNDKIRCALPRTHTALGYCMGVTLECPVDII